MSQVSGRDHLNSSHTAASCWGPRSRSIYVLTSIHKESEFNC